MVKFYYDDAGFRYKKEEFDSNEDVNKTTLYIRDLSGQVASIYTKPNTTYVQKEIPFYGASRIGTFINGNEYHYELKDHLGNVRETIKVISNTPTWADSKADYYPFGMKLLNPNSNINSYRYGYQGEYAEDETNEVSNSNVFQLRLYDARIGRWLSTDPKHQYHSPYIGMGNDPINGIDPDGGKKEDIIFRNKCQEEIGRIVMPGDDVIVDLDTDFETESPLTMTLDEYANLLDVSVDEIDAIGFGIEYSGTVGGGMNTGIEAVHYLSGKDKGGIFVYDKVGGQVGLEGSIGVYGFAAYKNEDLGPASADSWLGSFSFYDAGFAIGLSGFWSNSEGKNDLWPGHHGTVDWKGVSLGGAYYSPGFNFGAKWGYSDYSYANWIGNNVHK